MSEDDEEPYDEEPRIGPEDEITQLFTLWNAAKLSDYFGKRTESLLGFGGRFMMICFNDISHGNPAHITNEAMNKCLLKYPDWGPHISAGNRALIWKLMHNAQILHHQCKRYVWFMECDEEDETKKFILSVMEQEQCGQSFLRFIKSML